MDAVAAKALSDEFLAHVTALPDGDTIYECLQCGTCSASCPMSEAMEYSPRAILAALRAGMLDRVTSSNTPWLCSSCYSCAVRCPAGIPFTDVMYELKRLSVRHGLVPKTARNAVMAQAFVESVDRHGRNHEPELVRKYFLRTNPLDAVGQLPLGLQLFKHGRMPIMAHTIKGAANLRKMLDAVEETEKK